MTSNTPPRTLFDKIWAEHVVMQRDDGQSLLYVDRHLVQDGSAPAFEMLRQKGLTVRAPERAFNSGVSVGSATKVPLDCSPAMTSAASSGSTPVSSQ